MKALLIRLVASKAVDMNIKKILKVIGAFFIFLIFFPLIILQCLNPFSLFNSDKSNDLYVKVQQKIQSEKNINIDINLMRAVDAAFFSNEIDENSIEYRANRYYYHQEEITEVVDEKQPDGFTKKVEKKKKIYVNNTFDEVIAALKKDKNLSDKDVKNVDELYQLSLFADSDGQEIDTGGVTGSYKFTGTQAEFIKEIAPAAVRICKEYGLFPSVTLAQAVLESGAGKSSLAAKYKNIFGIKADSSWTGQKIRMATGENYGGNNVTVMAYFRVYSSWDGSIEDHAKFLKDNSTYRQHGVFSASTYDKQAAALQAAGYATDPHYAAELVKIIKDNKLDQYDR